MHDDFDQFLASLPIHERRDEILSSVDNNQVTIITAETGAGKSTQVPQYLAEHGYKKIIVTQPRILAARNLSSRVREEYSWRLGTDATSLVGYRTAHERDDSPENVILYCTDGLQLVRELTGSGVHEKQVLVLDEIHEWNENMEVLIAWAKKRCAQDQHFKVVLMSATIEAEELATYFGAPKPIAVPGRTYAVSKLFGRDILTEIIDQVQNKTCNMLVFLPGKAEIENIADALKGKISSRIPVLPLHSQLEPHIQQQVFESYPQGKVILTTNVAQTSITIDDIDVVIDSGLERRSEVRSGVEGLFLAEISKADCLQRAGRAGRTKEGTYILAQLDALPCSPLEQRDAYGVPEILRKHIDRLVLRLANIGIDIEDLEFYHSPSKKTIKLAKQTLVSLGALTSDGRVTAIGRKMERFPVESNYARMLVEAQAYPKEVQAKLATIIAIQEVGGIVKGGARYTGWRHYTRQTRSDLLAQYDVYLAVPQIDDEAFEELGIIAKNVTKAQEINERLNNDLQLGAADLAPLIESDVEPLLKCIVAGQLHQLWLIEDGETAIHIVTKKKRELSSGSVVKHASLVAGTPFDLEVPLTHGLETLHLVNDVTSVDPQWLEELAPDLFAVKPGKIYFDAKYGTLAKRTLVKYGGRTIEIAGVPLVEYTSENARLFVQLYSKWLHQKLNDERQALQILNHRSVPAVPVKQIEKAVQSIAKGAVSLLELNKKQRVELSKLSQLSTYLGEDYMRSLHTPDEHGRRRFWQRDSWRPPYKRKSKR